MAVIDRMKRVWNAFINASEPASRYSMGPPSFTQMPPSRARLTIFNDKTIVTSIYNRISIDVASHIIRHTLLDELGRYKEDINSQLNSVLTYEPNLDQSPRSFRQDIVMTLFSHGCAAIVPVDTTVTQDGGLIDIYSLRVGEIVSWYPKDVSVSLWNEEKGIREEVTLPKYKVAIVENPLYSVMNEPSSILQRLIRKLSLLDAVDEQSSSGKLDIIIQLPYVIKSEARRLQAEKRRDDIEIQLKGSKYGIAYTDGTEKITQLNRPAENNLMKQVEYLVPMLYAQLGITEAVMNGTADEATMINYHNRTVGPILDSIVESMQRAFLGYQKTQNLERIQYFIDPFKLVPVSQLADIADKFTRNEVLTSNEIRGFIGVKPSKEPKADKLVNSNMPIDDTGVVE